MPLLIGWWNWNGGITPFSAKRAVWSSDEHLRRRVTLRALLGKLNSQRLRRVCREISEPSELNCPFTASRQDVITVRIHIETSPFEYFTILS